MTKKWKTIRCSQSVFDRLDAISKILNRNKSAFLEELFTELFESCNHLRNGNVMYTSVMGKVILNWYGKSTVLVGTFPPPNLEQESKVPAIVKIIPEKKAKPIISKFPAKVKNDGN